MPGIRFLDGGGGFSTGPGSLEARGCRFCGFGENVARVRLPSGKLIALCSYHQARIGRADVLERAEQVARERPWP